MYITLKQFYDLSGQDFIVNKNSQNHTERNFYQQNVKADKDNNGLDYLEYLDYLQQLSNSQPLEFSEYSLQDNYNYTIPLENVACTPGEINDTKFFSDFAAYLRTLGKFDEAYLSDNFPILQKQGYFTSRARIIEVIRDEALARLAGQPDMDIQPKEQNTYTYYVLRITNGNDEPVWTLVGGSGLQDHEFQVEADNLIHSYKNKLKYDHLFYEALNSADAWLKNDPVFMQNIIINNDGFNDPYGIFVFSYLGDSLRTNEDFLFGIAEFLEAENSLGLDFYMFAPAAELKNNKDFFLRFLQRHPDYLTIKGFSSINLSVFYRDSFGKSRDPDLVRLFLQADSSFQSEQSGDARTTAILTAQQLIEHLADLHIDYWERFHSVETMSAILNYRQQADKPTDKPVALIIYNKSDHNGAFTNNQIDDLLRRGYAVFYYEAVTDMEAFSIIKDVGTHNLIDLLILGGHGQPKRLLLGDYGADRAADIEASGNNIPDEYSLDITDLAKTATLEQYLRPGASVSLESCSTGRDTNNIADFVYMLFGGQVHVYAPTVYTSADVYEYDNTNKLINIRYRDGITYHRISNFAE
jgi:hypothetical protein